MNKAVADELLAVHRYMYFHCDDQGYELLANLFRKTAIEEMMHVEKLSEHILFLGGEVEMQVGGEVQKIHEVKKMLELAAKMEDESAEEYNQWAEESSQNRDSNTRRLFESLVEEEERHFDQYDNEIANIGKFGESYLALQSIEQSRSYATEGE